MWLNSACPPINTKDLRKPNKQEQAFINTFKPDKSIKWFIQEAERTETTFAGLATKYHRKRNVLTDNAPYAIVLSSYVFMEHINYLRYLIEHEIKHCILSFFVDLPKGRSKKYHFRPHDVELIGINGLEEKAPFGFFNEEWEYIKCCDVLMKVFNTCEGIERYLE